jgi:hypothetical protein
MRTSTIALGTLLVSLFAIVNVAPSRAFTPEEVDAATGRTPRHIVPLIKLLASNRMHGRDNNSIESLLAQRLLVAYLKRLGPALDSSRSGDDAYLQPFVQSNQTGTNMLAVIPGRELPDEYVMVGAHYDHLGTRSNAAGDCSSRGAPGGHVCNGATDNAAGVAAVLAIGEALRSMPTPPRRSVVLALWDAEEDGLLGSLYYVGHPIVPLKQTVAYVNFDILGQDLLPSLHADSFAVGSETGGPTLQAIVDRASAGQDFDLHKVSYIFGESRSDYKNFVDRRVPTVFFSDSTGPCYHTTGDDLSIVNFSKLRAQARTAFRAVVELAETDTKPTFVPRNQQGAVFADSVSLLPIYINAQQNLDRFSATDRSALLAMAAHTQAIVDRGAAQFTSADAFTLLGDVTQAIDILTRSGCKK